MDNILFFDKMRELVMKFEKFQYNRDNGISFVNFNCIIHFGPFDFENNIEAEESDFKNLQTSLERVYRREQKFTFFKPLQGGIIMRFAEDSGIIGVDVNLYSDFPRYNFEFKYEIDQSFIPELIKEINTVIKNNIY